MSSQRRLFFSQRKLGTLRVLRQVAWQLFHAPGMCRRNAITAQDMPS